MESRRARVRTARMVLRVRACRAQQTAGHGVALLTGEGVLPACAPGLASRTGLALPGVESHAWPAEGAWKG